MDKAPSGGTDDSHAVPDVYRGRPGPVLVTLNVDGERFAIRQDGEGGTTYDWLSGPNKGYGFATSETPNRSVEAHQESIREFLAMIDPTTGYIEDEASTANLRQPQWGGRQGEDMATFNRSDDLRGAEFVDADLRGARFFAADLSGVVMRGVQVKGAEIDAPWLFHGESFLRVNGVDVIPFVDAELNRRFPGRADRRAGDPDGLRAAWAALQRAWSSMFERVAAMPAGTADVSVGGEWSFAQTLRHLVLATDKWLGGAILERAQPFHPIGLTAGTEQDGFNVSALATATPSYSEVLQARAGRVAMVGDFLATVTSEGLAAPRKDPDDPEHQVTTRSCLHVILEEEWEHHRFAARDLDAIEARCSA